RSKRDWSSDVCSSDLGTTDPGGPIPGITTRTGESLIVVAVGGENDNNAGITTTATNPLNFAEHYAEAATGAHGAITFSEALQTRSEERRVGKECRIGR